MKRTMIKCVVWDLDHTVWNGVLLEDDTLALRPGVREAMETLDQRGILQSIASKNERAPALAQVRRFGIEHFFLHTQINWEPKSGSIRQIAERLNLGLDAFAFIDDQVFEREEVAFALPDVRTFDPSELPALLAAPECTPKIVTEDARRRREMYQADLVRQEEENAFRGASAAFLATLGMALTVAPAEAADLPRVEELVARTNQLNTTGQTYSYTELETLRRSAEHRLLVAELTDKHGGYGKIGVVLLHCTETVWTIKLLLMSCRVMSRGIGGALITLLRQEARAARVALHADIRVTERNRMMYVTYKFAGFTEIAESDGLALLQAEAASIPELPAYLTVNATFGGVLHG